jgi:carbon-monoxide dehydrogenase large subunit
MTGDRFVGQAITRKEDARLVAGHGTYIADIVRPGMLHALFVRSPHAHARIDAIRLEAALALPGVVSIITAADIAGELHPVPGMQNAPPASWREAVEHRFAVPDQPLLATDTLRWVGEPFAIVVARTRRAAEDAADAVVLEATVLDAAIGIEAALAPDAPQVHAGSPGNVIAHLRWRCGTPPAPDTLRHLRARFTNPRIAAVPMECRGVVAEWDGTRNHLTVWSATQVVHWVRREVARQLGLPESAVRCIAPDVGGGFGVKGHVYPEDILVAWLARRLDAPVSWIETRSEHFIASTHSRDDRHEVEVAFDESGRIHSLVDHFVKDSGAFMPVGIGAPSNTATHIANQYAIGHLDLTATVIATNSAPNAPYRGSGRPEAVFVIERLMDRIGQALGIEPAEVRLRNMIGPAQMPWPVGLPYRDGVPIVYDAGDFPGGLRQVLEAIGGLAAFRERQQTALAAGRYLGLGLGCYVEGSGAGPFEGATVHIAPDGRLQVATGACSQGQGHETVFAQVAADAWQTSPDQVDLALGDTDAIERGYGTIASRSAVNSSAAILMASRTLRERLLDRAAARFECARDDLDIADGHIHLKGALAHRVALTEIGSGEQATEYFEPPTVTWSHGVHLALVEVDIETGTTRIDRYLVGHDAGVVLNPAVAEGQIAGGVIQGIGATLGERIRHAPSGQNLTGSLLDYALPIAADMPAVEVIHAQTPSTLNELGVKGLGEGGIVGPPAALVNAICDALRPFGVDWSSSVVEPAGLLAALRAPTSSRRQSGA